MPMKLLAVTEPEHIELFHQVAARIYQKDENWIPHVVKELEQLFDRAKNGAFQDGDAIRWVLFNRNFEPVGRIAAFYGKKSMGNTVGGIGFYECEEHEPYAKALFDQAETWLKAQGLESVEGPVNFGERHQFWGCQVEGFGLPIYQENYHPPYYQQQFLTKGYAPYFHSLCYQVNVNEIPFDWLEGLYKRTKTSDIEYRPFSTEQAETFAEDYLRIAAEAFQLANRTVKIDKNSILSQLNIQQSVLREEFIWFAYKNDQPVGVLGYLLNWSGLISNALNFGHEQSKKSLKGFLVAISPDQQQRCVLVGLLYHFGQALKANPEIDKLYICGIAEYSANVQSVAKKFNGKVVAKHLTFRKMF